MVQCMSRILLLYHDNPLNFAFTALPLTAYFLSDALLRGPHRPARRRSERSSRRGSLTTAAAVRSCSCERREAVEAVGARL